MTLIIITLGLLFGFSLQISKVNSFNTISGMAILKDYTVAKTIATYFNQCDPFIDEVIQTGIEIKYNN